MPALTADVRLRYEVLKDPNVILITEPGHSDKVIRVVPLPDCVDKFRSEQMQNRQHNEERKELQHLQIDLSRGPDQELWREVEREVFMKADRSKPLPKAAQVNNKLGEPWQLALEEVPTVNLAVVSNKAEAKPIENPVIVEEPKDVSLVCKCGKEAKTPTGLKVHRSKCKVK